MKSIFYSTVALAGLASITLALPLDPLIAKEQPLDKQNQIFARATEPVDNDLVTQALRFWNRLNKCIERKWDATGNERPSSTTPHIIQSQLIQPQVDRIYDECEEELTTELGLSREEIAQRSAIIERLSNEDQREVAHADGIGDYSSEGYDLIFRKPAFMGEGDGNGNGNGDGEGASDGASDINPVQSSRVHLGPLPSQAKVHSTAAPSNLFTIFNAGLGALRAHLKAATTANLQVSSDKLKTPMSNWQTFTNWIKLPPQGHWPVLPGSFRMPSLAPVPL
ncbi:MAG: hypothetical protein M1816_004561 [Peltula sp. TS41687]|nr:MAG: hypothetical protein M1816_004561 [Peltula sp. TS41687]